MNRERLLSLLQPKEYKSKIKLICREKKVDKVTPKKVAEVKNNNYICRIKIIEL